jgi:hypothetical protein
VNVLRALKASVDDLTQPLTGDKPAPPPAQ